jgi:hypothetical protein
MESTGGLRHRLTDYSAARDFVFTKAPVQQFAQLIQTDLSRAGRHGSVEGEMAFLAGKPRSIFYRNFLHCS